MKNPKYSPCVEGQEKDIYDAHNEGKIDLIHMIKDSAKFGEVYVREGTRKVPLIDASHHLQLHDEDENCSLYSFNFLQAIACLLDDETIAERIYHLAEQVNSGTVVEQEKAKKAIASFFQGNLK